MHRVGALLVSKFRDRTSTVAHSRRYQAIKATRRRPETKATSTSSLGRAGVYLKSLSWGNLGFVDIADPRETHRLSPDHGERWRSCDVCQMRTICRSVCVK